jgi:hypothetical protein
MSAARELGSGRERGAVDGIGGEGDDKEYELGGGSVSQRTA